MRLGIGIGVLALVSAGEIAIAQTDHSGHGDGMDHTMHGQTEAAGASVLLEPGQGAFAALSEVVRVLEADPNTDWGRVDLVGLRAHLVDMDRLISDAVVKETSLPNGISILASGDAETVATLRRMVPAHSAQLARDNRWTVAALETEDDVELRATSDNPAVIARIRGLGFFGLMASQDHHREHHLMMARGEDAHRH
ncbi:hypothetical protein SAMN05444004_11917 [Jannaschia faecimaris]|uniref:Uncharacterized protein n=1 Tax=Jannaschia faecimaris TaxID=1244108 RepID=A0A1H3TS44_9RHOB|nr:hypothetical protein [Jannaschia faecimaris]SDZ52505.1 hypothetical protein SAMN05444004_11917 [Jannaschia faecimaris]